MTNHIELRTTRTGVEKAFLSGTRTSVADIYVWHELQGMSPDQIAVGHPPLTLGQIHAALAYYFDNATSVRAQLEKDQEMVASFRATLGPGPLASKLMEACG